MLMAVNHRLLNYCLRKTMGVISDRHLHLPSLLTALWFCAFIFNCCLWRQRLIDTFYCYAWIDRQENVLLFYYLDHSLQRGQAIGFLLSFSGEGSSCDNCSLQSASFEQLFHQRRQPSCSAYWWQYCLASEWPYCFITKQSFVEACEMLAVRASCPSCCLLSASYSLQCWPRCPAQYCWNVC